MIRLGIKAPVVISPPIFSDTQTFSKYTKRVWAGLQHLAQAGHWFCRCSHCYLSNACSVWLSTCWGQREREAQDTKISRDEHGVLSHLKVQTLGTWQCEADLAQRVDVSTAELREGAEGGQSPSRGWRSSTGFGSSKRFVEKQQKPYPSLLATAQHTQALLVHTCACACACLGMGSVL